VLATLTTALAELIFAPATCTLALAELVLAPAALMVADADRGSVLETDTTAFAVELILRLMIAEAFELMFANAGVKRSNSIFSYPSRA
jgi:hypothetical protein